MDYNSILKKIKSDKKKVIDEIKNLEQLNEEELNKAKQLIEEKYSKLKEKPLNEFNEKVEEIYNYCKLIEEKSTMSSSIFIVIAELISIFEGENYILKRLRYHKDNALPSEVWETYMIISKDGFNKIENPNYISERYLNHLLKNNLAIKISENWSSYKLPSEISFYKVDNMNRVITQISFKGFSYIKQFVDYIINYRIENNILELSYEEMQKLKEDFILLNVDNINNNYKLKQEQRINNINLEYEHKQKILKRIVSKIEKNKQ